MGSNHATSPLTEPVYYILLSLFRTQHGYGIMQHVEEVSGGAVRIGPGTLYGALNTLLKKNWIQVTSEKGSRGKKEYLITDLGKEIFTIETKRLEHLATLGNAIVNGGD